MKLTEALSLRADLQKRISQLKPRLKNNSKILEGDEPAEKVEDLHTELDELLSQLEILIYRINETNMHTLHNGENLTRMDDYACQLRKLDIEIQRLNWVTDLL